MTVPSFRTSSEKDDAAKKAPAATKPCAKEAVTPDLDESNEGDMLPYPNKVITDKDQAKERTDREEAKKTAVRPSKYASNFEKPGFGAPQPGKPYYGQL